VTVAAPAECGLNGEQGKEKESGREAGCVGEWAHEESIAIHSKEKMNESQSTTNN
jgi:hypothetical protein